MRKFPAHLKPENKDKLSKSHYERCKCYLRRDLYEHIILHEEKDYFSLDSFNQRVNNMENTVKMAKELMVELQELGWKCKLAFGDTGLFIYSTENPPPNCWEAETLS